MSKHKLISNFLNLLVFALLLTSFISEKPSVAVAAANRPDPGSSTSAWGDKNTQNINGREQPLGFPTARETGVRELPSPYQLDYLSGVGNWNTANTKFNFKGHFYADNVGDIVTMYDYGNNTMGIWGFVSDGNNHFTPQRKYYSGAGNWDVSRTKFFVASDWNNDGYTDLTAFYDYGNDNMGIWVFTYNSGSASYGAPLRVYLSGPGNWSIERTKFVTYGDIDANGDPELGLFYDYGNSNLGIWTFTPAALPVGFTAVRPFLSGPGNWNVASTKFVNAGDYNDDGYAEWNLVYDYGSNTMGIWQFYQSGISMVYSRTYYSGLGNWSLANTKFVESDNYNVGQVSDMFMMYDYGNDNMGIWIFYSMGGGFLPYRAIYTGPGNWRSANTKGMVTGDYNGDGYPEVGALYDYGSANMGIWGFQVYSPV